MRDSIDPNHAGEYWSDDTILLALKAAQSTVLNYLLRYDISHLLSGLVASHDVTDSPETVPADFVAPLASRVGDPLGVQLPGVVAVGANADPYLYSKLKAISIVGDQIYVTDSAVVESTKGTLYYVKRPSPITTSGKAGYTAEQEFPIEIYNIIANVAVSILGAKEGVGKREQKAYSRVTQDLNMLVDSGEHIVRG